MYIGSSSCQIGFHTSQVVQVPSTVVHALPTSWFQLKEMYIEKFYQKKTDNSGWSVSWFAQRDEEIKWDGIMTHDKHISSHFVFLRVALVSEQLTIESGHFCDDTQYSSLMFFAVAIKQGPQSRKASRCWCSGNNTFLDFMWTLEITHFSVTWESSCYVSRAAIMHWFSVLLVVSKGKLLGNG